MDVEYSAFDIANWFLAKAKEETMELSPMKLQKLVYFAYGWYYAYYDKPLFSEKIFAWRHGPVVGDLYGVYKRFGGKAIVHDAKKPIVNDDTLEILNAVWNAYSPLGDTALSDIAHRINSPWAAAYKCGAKSVIEPEEIQTYFNVLYSRYEKTSVA